MAKISNIIKTLIIGTALSASFSVTAIAYDNANNMSQQNQFRILNKQHIESRQENIQKLKDMRQENIEERQALHKENVDELLEHLNNSKISPAQKESIQERIDLIRENTAERKQIYQENVIERADFRKQNQSLRRAAINERRKNERNSTEEEVQ